MPLRTEAQAGLSVGPALWCAICQVAGKHATNNCHLLQKFVQTPQQLFYNFCRSVGYDERNCRSYELMMDITPTYSVQAETRPPWPERRDSVDRISTARKRPRQRRTWQRSRTVDLLQLWRARTLCLRLH